MKTDQDIDFEKGNGLVPCIVQDANTGHVLMLGFMNREAYDKTLKEKRLTFYSRTKKRLWTKGETSGHFLDLISLQHDCDGDTLLAKAHPAGPVCHNGTDTCFGDQPNWGMGQLQAVIVDRKANPKSGSYTSELFNAGIQRIAQKVGEEAVELVIEAKGNQQETFLGEAADLMYHFMVLLAARGYTLEAVSEVLRARHAAR